MVRIEENKDICRTLVPIQTDQTQQFSHDIIFGMHNFSKVTQSPEYLMHWITYLIIPIPITAVSRPDAGETVVPTFFFDFFYVWLLQHCTLNSLWPPLWFHHWLWLPIPLQLHWWLPLWPLLLSSVYSLLSTSPTPFPFLTVLCCTVTTFFFQPFSSSSFSVVFFPSFSLQYVGCCCCLHSFLLLVLDSYSRSFFNFCSFFISLPISAFPSPITLSLALEPPSWSTPVFLLAASSVFLVFGLQYLAMPSLALSLALVYLSISLDPFSFYFDSPTPNFYFYFDFDFDFDFGLL